MKEIVHPYLKYAQALLLERNKLSSVEQINVDLIKKEIELGLSHFSVQVCGDYKGKSKVRYSFTSSKNSASQFVFLSPNVISTEKLSKNIYKSANSINEILAAKDVPDETTDNANKKKKQTKKEDVLDKTTDIPMSDMPICGEFNSFSEKGNVGRGSSKSNVYERCLAIITSLTPFKPCLQYMTGTKQVATDNVCIIPDLSIPELVDFIKLFKRLQQQKADKDLMIGHVKCETKTKGAKQNLIYTPKRPLLFRGNFPNPPYSSALGSVALLGAIGEMAKEEDCSELAKRVLESLKHAVMYMVKYGDAKTFSYNHYVVDLAKESSLKTIVDSIYYSVLYNEGIRTLKSAEYQKYDLFASRFLQLFNHAAFKDFLSFRAEYPFQLELLFKTYFIKMENIDVKIVSSARELGKWLNYVAYFAAKNEVKEDGQESYEKIRQAKAKVLVELESSTFSAKTGDALVAQAVTRAGRLSGLDAPESAALFMEKTASGELELEQAKNLLIAFSRLKNKKETTDQSRSVMDDVADEEDVEDYSND